MKNTIQLLGFFFVIFHKSLCEDKKINNSAALAPGFGEYILEIQSIADCNITEPVDKMFFDSIKIISTPKNIKDNGYFIAMNLKKKFKIVKIRTAIELWKYGKFVKMMEQNIINPCTHTFGKILLVPESIGNVQQCILKQGNYSGHVLNADRITHKMLGNKFFYGLCKGLIIYYTDDGVGFCADVDLTSRPKPKKQKQLRKL